MIPILLHILTRIRMSNETSKSVKVHDSKEESTTDTVMEEKDVELTPHSTTEVPQSYNRAAIPSTYPPEIAATLAILSDMDSSCSFFEPDE